MDGRDWRAFMEDMRMRWDVNENVWTMHKRGSVLFF
jgi:hypothetical protein